jgi:hypothetical protein
MVRINQLIVEKTAKKTLYMEIKMKANKKFLTVIVALVIIGTLAGCNKKNDAALAELNAKLEAMQAELEKAKSGNADPEEIAKMEAAVAEQEQRRRERRERGERGNRQRNSETETTAQASATTTEPDKSTATATTTPAASTTSAGTGGFQIDGTFLTKYTGSSKDVTIPNGITIVGSFAFKDNKNITSVIIPDSVTEIQQQAFMNCTSLKTVTINNVNKIDTGAFYGCDSLTSVNIGSRVTAAGNDIRATFGTSTNLTAINVDSGNTVYSSADGVLYNKNKTTLVAFPIGKAGVFTIPNSVTTIGHAAFWCAVRLANVTIPNTVKIIEGQAFQSSGISSIIIGNGVTSIEWGAFDNCESLTNVTFRSTIANMGDNLFPGNLREVYLQNGPGTYVRERGSNEWDVPRGQGA